MRNPQSDSTPVVEQILKEEAEQFADAAQENIAEYGASYFRVYRTAQKALERFLRTSNQTEDALAGDAQLQDEARERIRLILRSAYPNSRRLAESIVRKERADSTPPSHSSPSTLRLVR